MGTAQILLETEKLTKDFGGVRALNGLNLIVQKDLIQSVIGPNGAGKTTLFNVITGVLPPSRGEVFLNGEAITGIASHRVAAKGVTRTFQNLQLFSEMTVLENVMVGMHMGSKAGFFASAAKLPRVVREERRIREESHDWLRFAGLDHHEGKIAGSLPFGSQRILEFARALASRPVLLMLDEPAAGLNIRETMDLAQLIVRVRDLGITILFVEHDMDLVMEISDRVSVMDQGTMIAEGPPDTVRNNENVLRAYLGEA